MTLRQIEREHILNCLSSNKNNLKKTARDLDIGLATLYRKLKEYNYLTPRQEKKKCIGAINISQSHIQN